MKKLAILAAVALSAAFIPFKASAIDPILNVSATVKYQSPNSTGNKGSIASMSLNEKTIYYFITNALAGNALLTNNVSTLGAYIAPTNMPANGYIAFSPYATNADGSYGTFYVTNKSGFYYALSGLDTDGQYYSFIELDTYVYNQAGGFVFGYGYLFSALASYSVTSGTGTSTGVFFIHDNPYAYDDADYPDMLAAGSLGSPYYPANVNAIEIRGIVTAPFKFPGGYPAISSFSLAGTGNCMLYGSALFSLVSSGHMALTP